MFARDSLFAKKEDTSRKDPRALSQAQPSQGVSQRPPAEAPRAEPQPPVPAPARSASDGKGSKLIVGPDIKLKGVEITDCDTLVVEGRVEASMDSRVIQISEQGVFCGTAGIDIAEIRGRFEGELTVRKQLVIHATGRVTGKIRYGRLTVEDGGELTGDIGTMDAADPFGRRDKSAAPALKPPALV
jgi:cytoskeletal protein CcmA (bactofilin family)